ncbi:XrtA/PEP-CTERM system-associated ATPase [Novosphingobium sp. MD-1]|uniref:XrtA/PEP-CTERM system-associated ATPase n=1 Tax=Novosphingobium sp. MD-1 TaxID=1630648 RepID=UPI00061C8DCC|nr:XrtA/PEP-CTERM system-associated ATPase [Novosphingobium sp. MD-1]GAO55432.1 hypothetical protein NMD1_02543 [Novosphingobium sp. MD-1]
MYDTFYGLTGRPFQLTPDPDFYFESTTHRKALSYLGYGLAQGEGFIVITGEVGAGKSTLAAHLMATIDRQRLTAGQIVTSKLDGEELIHVAARAFGLHVPGHDKASALAAIEVFLHEEARAGRRCLLVVDEAQNLSIGALEELRMLSNFQLGAHPLLQMLLLGQPEFRTLLQTSPELEQLRQRVIASHHLDAMEAGEVGPYIEHRLARVGWTGNPAFEPRVYADLARASGGVPRRINQIVSRLLLMGAIEQSPRIDSAMLKDVLTDLDRDAAGGAVAARPAPAAEPALADALPVMDSFAAPEPALEHGVQPVGEAAPQAHAQPAFDLSMIQQALASRDEQIAELQQAVIELAELRPAATTEDPARDELAAALADANGRVAALETRLAEQEQAIRHVLTMLIEWLESEQKPRLAA